MKVKNFVKSLRPLIRSLLAIGLLFGVAAAPAALLAKQTHQAYLKAALPHLSDYFGEVLAISGDTLVVGVCYDDSGPLEFSGAVYVFVRDGAGWRQQAYLKAPNAEANDLFGYSVAISGNTLVVGARGEDSATAHVDGNMIDNSLPEAGAAYVFQRRGEAWILQAYLKPANPGKHDVFGSAVAISGDTLVVGAEYEDSAAGGVNANSQDNSLTDAGAAYVFVRSPGAAPGGSIWSQQAFLKADQPGLYSYFGHAVAVSGDTVLVGAWEQDGSREKLPVSAAGAGYVFTRSGSAWSQQAILQAANADPGDGLGWSVALDGDTAVLGAHFEDSLAGGMNPDGSDNSGIESGAAYVFVRSANEWRQQAYLKAANPDTYDHFGRAVAISDDRIVVGAGFESSGPQGALLALEDNSVQYSGAGYVYYRSGERWSLETILKAGNADPDDHLGWAVGISGNTVVLGAPFEDSAAPDATGDNSLQDAGAVYTFNMWSHRYFLPLARSGL